MPENNFRFAIRRKRFARLTNWKFCEFRKCNDFLPKFVTVDLLHFRSGFVRKYLVDVVDDVVTGLFVLLSHALDLTNGLDRHVK